MYWETALSSAIEVSIAIAGFSGIIAVFGSREGGSWNVSDRLRLQILLTASAVAGFFSFLPFILLEAKLELTETWLVGSALQIAWYLGIAFYRYRQASRVGATDIQTSFLMPLGVIVVLGAQIANVVIYTDAWLYVIGVLFQLSVGFVSFTRLLLDQGMRADEDST